MIEYAVKANYRVDWDILDFAKGRKGFGSRWRKWKNDCISSAHYFILLLMGLRLVFPFPSSYWTGQSLVPISFALATNSISYLLEKISIGWICPASSTNETILFLRLIFVLVNAYRFEILFSVLVFGENEKSYEIVFGTLFAKTRSEQPPRTSRFPKM